MPKKQRIKVKIGKNSLHIHLKKKLVSKWYEQCKTYERRRGDLLWCKKGNIHSQRTHMKCAKGGASQTLKIEA